MMAPIVLFVYNRLDHVMRVIEHLSACELASESILYVVSDGAKPGDERKVEEVREYLKTISGFVDVIVEERESNYGIEESEVEAITRLINIHGKLIILEDDLLVGKYFLDYMNKALDKYVNEKDVFYISGYQFGYIKNMPQTAFSKLSCTWGWATWKDRWDKFEMPPIHPEEIYNNPQRMYEFCYDNAFKDFGTMLVSQAENNEFTWDICWYINMFNNGLVLLPRQTLVYNMGFDGSGVHGDNSGSPISMGKVSNSKIMFYPDEISEKCEYRKMMAKALKRWTLKRKLKGRVNRCMLKIFAKK